MERNKLFFIIFYFVADQWSEVVLGYMEMLITDFRVSAFVQQLQK